MSDIVDNLKKFLEIKKAKDDLIKAREKPVDPKRDLADRLHKALNPKVLIRPDVVSKPETFNEDGKKVTRPNVVSGPTMLNVRKAQQQVQDKHDEIDMGNYVNKELQLAEKPGEQLYHIHEGKTRISSKPMSLKDITAKHGPVQKLESAGFRLIPHTPQPSQPGTPLRRST